MTLPGLRPITGFLGLMLLAVALLAAPDGDPATQNEKGESTQELIDRLNHKEFKVREAASRALIDRDGILPTLRTALRSEHAEVRKRAGLILQEKQKSAYKLRLQRLPNLIKNGEIDSVIDCMFATRESVDQKTWDSLQDLAKRAWDANAKKHRCSPGGYPTSLKQRVVYRNERIEDFPMLTSLHGHHGLAPEFTRYENLGHSFVLTPGRVTAKYGFFNSVIFANDDITIGTTPGSLIFSFVVCDGSIKANDGAGSLLIATGAIEFKENASSGAVCLPNAREALGVLKFFDLRQVGIEVEQAKAAVLVKKLEDGKSFARAGLRAGDRIVGFDGAEVRTVKEFRRMVRRKAVGDEEVVLTVERSGKPPVEIGLRLSY